MASLASLPSALLARVLLLSLSKDVDRVVPEPIDEFPLREMQTLALVGREWHGLIEQLHRRLTRRRVDLVVARRGFCVKRDGDEWSINPRTPDLDVEIVRLKINHPNDGREPWPRDWHAVMKSVPNLRRLDLSKVSIRDPHLPMILEAASMHCSRVEALLLTHVDWQVTRRTMGRDPFIPNEFEDDDAMEETRSATESERERWGLHGSDRDESDDDMEHEFYDDSDGGSDADSEDGGIINLGGGIPSGRTRLPRGHELDPVMNALCSALKRWYEAGANHGLRELAIIERRTVDIVDANNQFLDAVAAYCPRLAYLKVAGYSKGADLEGNLLCDLDVWERFCRSCVSLRELDLSVVPFSDLYLIPFAAALKPLLKSLTIGYEEHEDGFPSNGLHVSPTVLASIFENLPALETLNFKCRGEPSATLAGCATLLTDDLVKTIVSNCPRFRELDWRIMCDAPQRQIALTQFTDASLESLATLPLFEKLEVPWAATACTEVGLLAMVRSNRSSTALRRSLQLELDAAGERGSVLAFMDRLLDCEGHPFGRGYLTMQLRTRMNLSNEEGERLQARLAVRGVSATFMRSFVVPGVPMVILQTASDEEDY